MTFQPQDVGGTVHDDKTSADLVKRPYLIDLYI